VLVACRAAGLAAVGFRWGFPPLPALSVVAEVGFCVPLVVRVVDGERRFLAVASCGRYAGE
jgi:hypothetical protein